MRHRLAAVVGGLLLLAASDARADEIDDYIQREIRGQRIPGLALAVLKDGKVVKMAGYGVANRALGTRVTPETVFRIGSIGKQCIAVGIMRLVEEGRLSLDDEIARFLEGAPPAWKGITIRQVLSHTAGLPVSLPLFDGFKNHSDADVIRSTYDVPMRFQPGTKAEYANVGYFILPEVIRKVTGQPWSDYLDALIFKPLGMTATRMATGELPPNSAVAYHDNDALRPAEIWPFPPSAGPFQSTVIDLAKYEASLYTNAILKDATRAQMAAAVPLADGSPAPYGLGWELKTLDGYRQVHHGGKITGFLSEFNRFPEAGVTVIIVINLDDADLNGIIDRVARFYLPKAPGPQAP